MITSISIQNFQSIGELSIECGPITVLHGESDTGKSAFVRALYGLGFNSYPKGHVREGASESAVSVVVDGEVEVQAVKGGGENRYALEAVDGTELRWDKVGVSVPEAVQDLLGWRVVELDDGTKFTPGFQLQFDPPFLLTESPSRVAKVLGALTNIATLYAAVKEGNRWEREASKNIGAEEDKRDEAEVRIEELGEQLAADREKLQDFMQVVAEARMRTDAVETMRKLYLRTVEQREIVTLTRGMIEMLDEGDPSEEIAEIGDRLTRLQGLKAQGQAVEAAMKLVRDTRREVERLRQGEADIEAEIEEFKAEHSVCPLCGSADWGGHG